VNPIIRYVLICDINNISRVNRCKLFSSVTRNFTAEKVSFRHWNLFPSVSMLFWSRWLENINLHAWMVFERCFSVWTTPSMMLLSAYDKVICKVRFTVAFESYVYIYLVSKLHKYDESTGNESRTNSWKIEWKYNMLHNLSMFWEECMSFWRHWREVSVANVHRSVYML
jgi:hypothetical protein